MAAPLAAIIGVAISSESVNYAKAHHQSVGVYNELTYVILGMSVLILVSSWLRKRLFQGITMALYGLAVFNLHYWGFGIPFLLGGSWYLVNGLSPAAGAQAGRWWLVRCAAAQRQPTHERLPASGQQALHATHLTRSREQASVSAVSALPERRRRPVGFRASHVAGAATAPPTISTRIARRTAGRMKTLPDECSVSTMETGETSAGSPGTATALILVPGAWNAVPGSRSLWW